MLVVGSLYAVVDLHKKKAGFGGPRTQGAPKFIKKKMAAE